MRTLVIDGEEFTLETFWIDGVERVRIDDMRAMMLDRLDLYREAFVGFGAKCSDDPAMQKTLDDEIERIIRCAAERLERAINVLNGAGNA